MFFGKILGKVAKPSLARCRTMCRVLHPKLRRGILAQRFVRRLIRRDSLLLAIADQSRRKELEEAERDIFHAKMNRHLWVAANETTTETNICTYEVKKMRKEERTTGAGKRIPIPYAKTALPQGSNPIYFNCNFYCNKQ